MKFSATSYLWALWVFPAVVLFTAWAEGVRANRVKNLISPDLWSVVIPDKARLRRGLKSFLVIVGFAFLILALLKPQWGYELKEVKRQGVDVFVLVDTSRSMEAQDVSPSRMERAKRELVDFTKILKGDRVGLIPFAGKAYVACPLTTDYEAFVLFVNQLDSDLIPVQGTDISGAINTAIKSFEPTESRSKSIILMTDGEATEGDLQALIEQAKSAGVKIFVMGIGTEAGAPIPSETGGFKQDKAGQVVVSKLDQASLKNLALSTGGTYVRSVTSDADLVEVYFKGIKNLEESELKSGKKQIPIERFQFPLGIALFFFVMDSLLGELKSVKKTKKRKAHFKKQFLTGIILVGLCLLTQPLWASNPFSFEWFNHYYKQGNYQKAEGGYKSLLQKDSSQPKVHYNLGNTYYRQNKFLEAQKEYEASLNASDASLREEALYNLGNTLYRQNKLKEAVDFYNKALATNPQNKKAELNRDFVLKKLKEQEQKQQENQNNQNNQNNDQQNQQDQKDQQKNQEEDQQQNQDQNQKQEDSKNQNSENQPQDNQGREGDQEKKDEKQRNQNQENQENQPQDQNKDQNKPQKDQGQNESEKQSPQSGNAESGQKQNTSPQDLSKSEAEHWLESVEDDPKKAIRDMILRDTKKSERNPEKDW